MDYRSAEARFDTRWLEDTLNRCETKASLPLDAIRRPRDTLLRKLPCQLVDQLYPGKNDSLPFQNQNKAKIDFAYHSQCIDLSRKYPAAGSVL